MTDRTPALKCLAISAYKPNLPQSLLQIAVYGRILERIRHVNPILSENRIIYVDIIGNVGIHADNTRLYAVPFKAQF